jgi:hypothetical protein
MLLLSCSRSSCSRSAAFRNATALFFFSGATACSSTSPASPAHAADSDASLNPVAEDAPGPDTAVMSEAAEESSVGGDIFGACMTEPHVGDFPPDVGAVLHGKCQTCHRSPPVAHAPFPLLTYEQTQRPDPITPYNGLPIWQAMHYVIQATPPNGGPHMPLGNAPQLTPSELRILDDWLTGCAMPAAEGSGADADNGSDAGLDAHAATDAASE